jgi:phage/plasmid-like protein (TIGR03299 family)
MAHELATINNKIAMAYVGEKPWHELGTQLPEGATPFEMMKVANLDWTVEKHPLSYKFNNKTMKTNRSALIRSTDGFCLDTITNDWEPVQNIEAFEFFNHWTDDGSMTMETAGALKDGRIVWALAKVKNGAFNVVKGDKVESFLLFTNPHIYGKSTTVMLTNIRVVCNNTLTMAMNAKAQNRVRVSHQNKFDPEMVRLTLGLSKKTTEEYRERAKFLATKNCSKEQISDYINALFPIGEKAEKQDKEFSKPGKRIFEVIETQPGANLAPGTFWNLFNAVTFATDHVLGNSVDTRLQSAWYGANAAKKQEAMKLALEMAS